MKGIGKERLRLLRLAETRGFITFSDMRRNQLPTLIFLGLIQYFSNSGETLKYVLTEQGRELLADLKKEKGNEFRITKL